ncbi:hypothetical protein [Paenibacillus donghaensis]|uniref:hypothetical protein n=1 Tax=Paenibacillus donghaensis TaxID=414771 RepID=UPI0012FE3502|nr:hypothetical protein [Paenibacillus donghaensis]
MTRHCVLRTSIAGSRPDVRQTTEAQWRAAPRSASAIACSIQKRKRNGVQHPEAQAQLACSTQKRCDLQFAGRFRGLLSCAAAG